MPAKSTGAGKKKKRPSTTNAKEMILGGMKFGAGSLKKYKHPQHGWGWKGTHPQYGSGFFDKVGNFFKGAANKVADAGKWAYNNVIKPAVPAAWEYAKPLIGSAVKSGLQGLVSGSGYVQPAVTVGGMAMPRMSTR